MTEAAHAPVAAAGGVVGQDELGREVAIERQSVEVGTRKRAHVLDLDAAHHAAPGLAALERPHRVDEGLLTLEEDRLVEGAERRLQARVLQAHEDLRDGRTADDEVDAGRAVAEDMRQRVGRLDLPGERHRDADHRHRFPADALGDGDEGSRRHRGARTASGRR